jgi:hypothetical protein
MQGVYGPLQYFIELPILRHLSPEKSKQENAHTKFKPWTEPFFYFTNTVYCIIGWVDIGTRTKVPLKFVTYLSKITKINKKVF